jgi:predicted nucleotidyltransferase
MDEFWEKNLILRVAAGSRAHGLARDGSDEDTRGVCIPPKEYLLGLEAFEQHESPGSDHVVFALAKFVRLALEGNPNILEVLYTDPQHLIHCDAYGKRLLENRGLFLSRRVGERFCGYAVHQLKRMERHHRWVTNPPKAQPTPEEHGAESVDGRYRFPHTDAERSYRAALKHWNHYRRWRENRHPDRAELEARFGYDTKHAMHLLRLLRMGEETLRDGIVRVMRPDRDWLLGVRDGALEYEEVLRLAAESERRLAELLEDSPLPAEPHTDRANSLLVELQHEFLFGVGRGL